MRVLAFSRHILSDLALVHPGRAISPFNLHATIISPGRTPNPPALRFSDRCARAWRAFENARLAPAHRLRLPSTNALIS